MVEAWPWLVRDGRLRTLWRVLLFALLFAALLLVELLFLPTSVSGPAPEHGLSPELVAQAAAMLAAAVLAGWAMLRWVDRRPIRDLGFGPGRAVPRDLALGTALGAAGPIASVGALALAGAFVYHGEPGTAGGWLGVAGAGLLWLAIPAAAEEALFRGYAFRTLAEGAGPVAATVVMSGLFTLAHGGNPNVDGIGLANIFLAGVALSAAVLWTGSLWFATAVHLGWNWAMAAGLDLPVSGLRSFDPPLYDGEPAGPAWLTGGPFGPEGGVAGTVAVLVVLALVAWCARGRRVDGAAGRTPARVVGGAVGEREAEQGRTDDGEDR